MKPSKHEVSTAETSSGSHHALDVVQAKGGMQQVSAIALQHASEVALEKGLLLILVPHAPTSKG